MPSTATVPVEEITRILVGTYRDAAGEAIDAFGLGVDFEYVDRAGLDYAQNRGAELVGMRRLSDGTLVENPNAEWAISSTTRTEVKSLLDDALTEGWSPQRFADRLEESGVFSESRAEMIARTETAIAHNAGQVDAFKEAGVEKLLVMDGDNDEWGCDCPTYNEQVCSVEWAMANPTEHPNCLADGSALVLAPHRELGFSRRFDGELVVLRTGADQFLAVTPNHPVLTDKGWRAAKAIRQGDNVIRSTRERDLAALVDPDHDEAPAPIEQVAGAARVAGKVPTRTMKAAAEYFHGDGEGSEVYVERTLGLLRDGVQPAQGEKLAQVGLGRAGVQNLRLAGRRAGNQFLGRTLHSPGCLVGRGGDRLSRPGRKCAPPQELRLRLRAADPEGAQPLPHGRAGCAESLGNRRTRQALINVRALYRLVARMAARSAAVAHLRPGKAQPLDHRLDVDSEAFGKLIRRFPGFVSAAKVIAVDRRQSSGHVHNLQTREGWYLANGIVTHNCTRAFSPLPYGEDEPITLE